MKIYYDRINSEVEEICDKYKKSGAVDGIYTFQGYDDQTYIINVVVNELCSMPMIQDYKMRNHDYLYYSLEEFGMKLRINFINKKKFDDIGLGFLNDDINILINGDINYDPKSYLHRIKNSGSVLLKLNKK